MLLKKLLQIGRLAGRSYAAFLRKSTTLIVLFALVYFLERLIFPMKTLCLEYGYSVSPLEGYLQIITVTTQVFVIPLVFIMLLSDFPERGTSGYFYLIRASRRVWMLGQLLFALLTGASFLLFLLAGTAAFLLPCAQQSGGWGSFNTTFSSAYPQIYAEQPQLFLHTSVVAQGTPLGITVCSTLLMLGYLLILALLLMAFRQIAGRLIGLAVDLLLTAAGFISVELELPWMWLLPAAHVMVGSHFSGLLSRPVFPLWGSTIYLLAVLSLLVLWNLYLLKHCHWREGIE